MRLRAFARLMALALLLLPPSLSAEAMTAAAGTDDARGARLMAVMAARLTATRRAVDHLEELAAAVRDSAILCPGLRLVLPGVGVVTPIPPTATATATPTLRATITPLPTATGRAPAGRPLRTTTATVPRRPAARPLVPPGSVERTHLGTAPYPAEYGMPSRATRAASPDHAMPAPGARVATTREIFGRVVTRRDLFAMLGQAPRRGMPDPWRSSAPSRSVSRPAPRAALASGSLVLSWRAFPGRGHPGEADITSAGTAPTGPLLRDRSGRALMRALLWLLASLAKRGGQQSGLAPWMYAPAASHALTGPHAATPPPRSRPLAAVERRGAVPAAPFSRTRMRHSGLASLMRIADASSLPARRNLSSVAAGQRTPRAHHGAGPPLAPAAHSGVVDGPRPAVPVTTVTITVAVDALTVRTPRGRGTTAYTTGGSGPFGMQVTSVDASAWDSAATRDAARRLRTACQGTQAALGVVLAADLQALGALQAQGDRLYRVLHQGYQRRYNAFVARLTQVATINRIRSARWMGFVWRYRAYTQRYREWAARERAYARWATARYAHLVAVARWHARKDAYDRYATALAAYQGALPAYHAQVTAGTRGTIPPPPQEPPWPGGPPAFTWVQPQRLPRPGYVPIPPAPPYQEPLPLPPTAPPGWQGQGPATLRGLGRGALVLPFAADYVVASTATGVPLAVLLAQDAVESSFRPWVDQGQHKGLGQMGSVERRRFGVQDAHDPLQSILGQARYDALLYRDLGSWSAVFAAYNEGEGAYRARGTTGVESYRDGTTYLDRIATALETLTSRRWLEP